MKEFRMSCYDISKVPSNPTFADAYIRSKLLKEGFVISKEIRFYEDILKYERIYIQEDLEDSMSTCVKLVELSKMNGGRSE